MEKSTVSFTESGIIRRMDDLGRVVFVKELRRFIRADENTPCELIPARDDKGCPVIVVRPYDPFAITLNTSRSAAFLTSLKEEIGDKVHVFIKSRHGARIGDIPADDTPLGGLIQKEVRAMEDIIFIDNRKRGNLQTKRCLKVIDVEEDISLSVYAIVAEDDFIVGALFGYGKTEDVNAVDSLMSLSAKAMSVF